MSKFENETERKVKEAISSQLDKHLNIWKLYHSDLIDDIMLRIRPYLKVQKKWMGDTL